MYVVDVSGIIAYASLRSNAAQSVFDRFAIVEIFGKEPHSQNTVTLSFFRGAVIFLSLFFTLKNSYHFFKLGARLGWWERHRSM